MSSKRKSATDRAHKCPTCGLVDYQPATARAVGHACGIGPFVKWFALVGDDATRSVPAYEAVAS